MEGQARKIGIEVNPDCQVKVLAPEDAKRADIHDAVMNRAKWIHDSLHAFKEQRAHVQPRRYVSGEMQFYLGRRYVLKIVEDGSTTARVKMDRGRLLVTLPDAAQRQACKAQQVRNLVNQWYRIRAEQVFQLGSTSYCHKPVGLRGHPTTASLRWKNSGEAALRAAR
jgi:predicted metal-dependent hydrolase